MKTKNIFKKITSLLLVFMIIIPIFNQLVVYTEEEENKYFYYDGKISTELKEIISKINSDDKTPVYIWLTDIDHISVDFKVKERTGLTRENLEVISEDMSENLAKQVSDLEDIVSEDAFKNFQEYFTRTESERLIEQERTDTYVMSRREISKQQYNDKSSKFISDNKIKDDDIIFSSNYAPMVIVKLTKEEIENVSKCIDTVSISKYADIELQIESTPENLTNRKNITRVTEIHENLGLIGTGVTAGMIDSGICDLSDPDLPNDRFYTEGSFISGHATHCAKVFAGNHGIAPGTTVHIGSLESIQKNIEMLIEKGATVISCSVSAGFLEGSSYTSFASWIDHVVSNHNITFLSAAGNDPNKVNGEDDYTVRLPASADNVIAVTAVNMVKDDKWTSNITEHTMFNYQYGQRLHALKPDIVASGGDTSSATPYAAGIVVLMQQLRPSLKTQPEASKAILMASCQYKANPYEGTPREYMYQGITERQGAGVMSAYLAIAITGQGNYGVRTIDSGEQQINLYQPAYNSTGLNISLSWLRNVSHISEDDFNIGVRHDLDLYLMQGSSSVGHSLKNTSTTEMLYVAPSSTNPDYSIKVRKYNSGSENVRYGYAWSINNNRFQFTQDLEGIYFLKNKNSGYYLNLNTGSMENTQVSYNGSNIQQWLLGYTGSNSYTLKNCYNSIGSMMRGSLLSSNEYKAVVSTGQMNNITIDRNDDGSIILKQNISGVTYALGIYKNSISSGAIITWSPYSSTNESQKWYLEKLGYQRGDVNMDGFIDTNDAYLVGEHLTSNISFNNLQKFLSDINGDGFITILDIISINQIISNQI